MSESIFPGILKGIRAKFLLVGVNEASEIRAKGVTVGKGILGNKMYFFVFILTFF